MATGAGKESGTLSVPPQPALELFELLADVDWTDDAQAIDAWLREDEVLLARATLQTRTSIGLTWRSSFARRATSFTAQRMG